MKKQTNHIISLSNRKVAKRSINWWPAGVVSSILVVTGLLQGVLKAEVVAHDIAAASLSVIQPSTTDSNAITVHTIFSVNDFRARTNSNNGDFNVQIGPDPLDDVANGVLMSSISENSRNNDGIRAYSAVSMIANNAAGYFIPVNSAGGLGAGANEEFNINAAGAWFPYQSWLGGVAINTANGGPLTVFTGSPGLVLGTHFIDNSAGKSTVDLRSLGIDSRTNGILLVSGAKNESANFGLGQVNVTNGTWNLFIKDVGQATATSFEQDGIAFVFIPKTNTSVISGRFLGGGAIDMYSGDSPQFSVSQLGVGRYELKIIGRPATNGVLIVSHEGGGATNQDNFATYQINAANDGWEIQTRDTAGTVALPPILESPSPTEGVVSFVYVPIATAGITVAPSNNLVTTELGGTANFSVSLDTAPTSDVTIAVSSSDLTEGIVSTGSLTFTPVDWNIPQPVTITGQDDALADGSVLYTVILSAASSVDPIYNGRDPVDVSVVNTDNEGGVTINPVLGLVTTEAGGPVVFNIRLNTQPSANVSIPLSSSDLTEGSVSPSSVVFTTSNWNTDQPVTVTGADDLIDDGDIIYSIVTGATSSSDSSYNGINPVDVSVTNTDDDTAGIEVSASGPAGLIVVEGKTNGYTVVLQTQPTVNVTVNIVSSDTAQGGTVSPSSLAFTPANWNTPQSVTVTGSDDLILDGNTSYKITNSVSSADVGYSGVSPVTVSVTTRDNEPLLTLPSGDLIYGIGLTNVGINGRATLIDANTTNYDGANITVTLTANGTADDRLTIRNSGSGIGQVGISGSVVSYSGTPTATFSGGVGTTPLVVTFNSSATPEKVEAVLQSISFHNVNSSPSLNRRAVSVVLVKADGGISSVNTGIRVSLLRAVSFQEGTDHGYGKYIGESDIYLQEADPNTPHPTGNVNGQLFVDFPEAGGTGGHVLMRFDNIFGNGTGEIPTNAIIVSADLQLTVVDNGHASPLYRMLRDWDATNETWSSIGSGVDPDDVEARSTFDSPWGTQFTNGTTTLGAVSFSVLPDITVWQSGLEANHGWVMPGWVGNNNGTGIRPGEAVITNERPRLRILWLPQSASTATFRQGVNGYASSFDTRIRETSPDTQYSTTATVLVDAQVAAGAPNAEQVLIRFDNIIGNSVGQIPVNSQIHAAVIDLSSITSDAMGDGGTFHSMLQPWDHTNTWNMLVNGVSTDDVEASATPTTVAGSSTLNPDVQGGYHTYELTPDLQAWANGARPNYGWVILPWPGGGNGWGIGMAESAAERSRPQLRVYYTPGPAAVVIQSVAYTSTTVTITFSGEVGTTYSVRRSGTVDGTYGIIGTAVVQPNGTATFIDNAPLSGAAFYRISNP